MTGLPELRRDIHRHPDRSGEESATAQRLRRFFEPLQPDEIIEGLGGTGIAFVFASNKSGPTVMLRAELDALPIQELNEFGYRSIKDGTSHKCGHDGHMTILAAVGQKLSLNRPARGKAMLLYQPAEETGQGAAAVVADKQFAAIKPDYAFALHNLPGFALGEIIIREGTFSCASRGMTISLHGKTAHAAQPETGVSPTLAMCRIIDELNALPLTMECGDGLAFATVVGSRLGERAFGIAPGDAEIWVTLRSETDKTMRSMAAHVGKRVGQLATEHGLNCAVDYQDVFRATVNADIAVDIVRRAAVSNQQSIAGQPFRWSEDFGCFATASNIAMFGVGAGTELAELHNPDYDFPDELIPLGRDIFLNILEKALQMPQC